MQHTAPVFLVLKVLGALVAGYVLYSLATGAVFAKRRARGRTFYRDEDPKGFRVAIGAYAVLALVLRFVF